MALYGGGVVLTIWRECSATDSHSLLTIIKEVQPDRIFHLAAQSFVPASWKCPQQTIQTNVIGQLNLLEAVRRTCPKALVHIAGSSEEYGLVYPSECPIDEDQPLRPMSPYGVSKVAQDLLGRQYFYSYGTHVIITRAFNHEGPRRGKDFVISSFAKQIAEIEVGLRPPVIYVGDLSTRRDWTDVRDMVGAYWLALELGYPGDPYNIGSGTDRTVLEMLEMLLDRSGVNVLIEVDPARLRPSDVPLLQADCTKFYNLTGWKPAIPFTTTLNDTLQYWRNETHKKGLPTCQESTK